MAILNCSDHGQRIAATVCVHILQARDRIVGFIENSSDPDDLQAWCDECEQFFLREGELTEAFTGFADPHVVCDFCYAALKARHAR